MYGLIEAEVRNGYIIPSEPEKLPIQGKAVIIILQDMRDKPDLEEVRRLLGWFRTDIDSAEWQKSVRSEWDERL